MEWIIDLVCCCEKWIVVCCFLSGRGDALDCFCFNLDCFFVRLIFFFFLPLQNDDKDDDAADDSGNK
ncbi:hypothetical protein TVAG_378160 [Trichomonas vaginalis G3]|uniref:Uncharacterized protein n=1 Tax=Trichomonas vaginalis (strain ATCC PRA-98 / G3) TaxID=412133 RepID=A2DB07_TRIV3|nr:hypothetical protein TVAG_378160 [Trichomonas vaginalis G3]|eukprot:XP_001583323.1 hypothetical protein [Trichomonas vaginalis G3]